MGELADALMHAAGAGPPVVVVRHATKFVEPELTTVAPVPVDAYLTCRRCWTGHYDTEVERDGHEAQCAEGRATMGLLTEAQKADARTLLGQGFGPLTVAERLGISAPAVRGMMNGKRRRDAAQRGREHVPERVADTAPPHSDLSDAAVDYLPPLDPELAPWQPAPASATPRFTPPEEAPKGEVPAGPPTWTCNVCRDSVPPAAMGEHMAKHRALDARTPVITVAEAATPAPEAERPGHTLRYCDVLDGSVAGAQASRVLSGLLPGRRYRVAVTAEEVKAGA